MRKRAQDFDLAFGQLPRGRSNAITDVPGVRVGHRTVWSDSPAVARTGVTAVIPGEGDLFEAPVFAAAHVINGFGKSTGLVQLEELGNIETPVLLTNTLNVGLAADALVGHTLARHPGCTSVNPLVAECNDARLNHIQTRSVGRADVLAAIDSAQSGAVATGAVGAGTGMVCFGYKGGIGTASRQIRLPEATFTLGALVLSNFGRMGELTIKGQAIAPFFQDPDEAPPTAGSIIVLLGTDLPLEHRQLQRLARRAAFGIARTGGRCAHGSGEIAIAFSTANRMTRADDRPLYGIRVLNECAPAADQVFEAVIDSVEEAIVDSLFTAETVQGDRGLLIRALPVEALLARYRL